MDQIRVTVELVDEANQVKSRIYDKYTTELIISDALIIKDIVKSMIKKVSVPESDSGKNNDFIHCG